MFMGLEGSVALVTATKLFAGAGFHVILYLVGVPVTALYDKPAISAVDPEQTPAILDAVVIVGKGLIVMVKVFPVLIQPFAFFTVRVPVYVPANVPAGMLIVKGLTGKAESVILVKELTGEEFQTIL